MWGGRMGGDRPLRNNAGRLDMSEAALVIGVGTMCFREGFSTDASIEWLQAQWEFEAKRNPLAEIAGSRKRAREATGDAWGTRPLTAAPGDHAGACQRAFRRPIAWPPRKRWS
jgi:hypothetical protein